MAVPTEITVTGIADADLGEFLSEIAEEGKYDVVSTTKDNGTWTVKLKRKPS